MNRWFINEEHTQSLRFRTALKATLMTLVQCIAHSRAHQTHTQSWLYFDQKATQQIQLRSERCTPRYLHGNLDRTWFECIRHKQVKSFDFLCISLACKMSRHWWHQVKEQLLANEDVGDTKTSYWHVTVTATPFQIWARTSRPHLLHTWPCKSRKRWWISSMASIIENQTSMVSGRMRVAFSSLESNKTSCQRPALSQARSATYWQRTARLQDSNSLTMRRWRWRVWAVAAWERRGVPLGKVRGTSQTSAIDCCTELLTSHWYTVFGGLLVPPSWDA